MHEFRSLPKSAASFVIKSISSIGWIGTSSQSARNVSQFVCSLLFRYLTNTFRTIPSFLTLVSFTIPCMFLNNIAFLDIGIHFEPLGLHHQSRYVNQHSNHVLKIFWFSSIILSEFVTIVDFPIGLRLLFRPSLSRFKVSRSNDSKSADMFPNDNGRLLIWLAITNTYVSHCSSDNLSLWMFFSNEFLIFLIFLFVHIITTRSYYLTLDCDICV